jgi:hypothetical protein
MDKSEAFDVSKDAAVNVEIRGCQVYCSMSNLIVSNWRGKVLFLRMASWKNVARTTIIMLTHPLACTSIAFLSRTIWLIKFSSRSFNLFKLCISHPCSPEALAIFKKCQYNMWAFKKYSYSNLWSSHGERRGCLSSWQSSSASSPGS